MQPATPTPLLVNHEVVSLPSLTTLATLRQETQNRPRAPKMIAALADPVFDPTDERVKPIATTAPSETTAEQRSLSRSLWRNQLRSAADNTVTIPRLPATRLEAEAVLALAPAGMGRIALDFQANRQFALSSELAQYRYLLFATHGWLDAERPELSALILSLLDEQGRAQEGFLRSHEIYNLNLPAELVVLSACETGPGKHIKGEGLVGLTRGFKYLSKNIQVLSCNAIC
jgi:CHAT domain-containing protein